MRNLKLLVWKWTTSRAQNTAGYNICSLYIDDSLFLSSDNRPLVIANWKLTALVANLLFGKERIGIAVAHRHLNYTLFLFYFWFWCYVLLVDGLL